MEFESLNIVVVTRKRRFTNGSRNFILMSETRRFVYESGSRILFE